MSYNMFTHVFDEMERDYKAYKTLKHAHRERVMARACMEKAVAAMTLIVRGFTIEYVEAMAGIPIDYADIECWDAVVVACTRFELSRVSEWTNKAVMYLARLDSWDEYFEKADELEQQARNLCSVARALSQLRTSV